MAGGAGESLGVGSGESLGVGSGDQHGAGPQDRSAGVSGGALGAPCLQIAVIVRLSSADLGADCP